MIVCISKNEHGAWVVIGEIGIRQYYYCTKKEARRLYIEECKKERKLYAVKAV